VNSQQFAYCKFTVAPMRKTPDDRSELVSQLLFGEIIEIHKRQNQWLYICNTYDNYFGWIDEKQINYLSASDAIAWKKNASLQWEFILEILTPWGKQNIVRGSFIDPSNNDSFQIGSDRFVFLSKEKKSIPFISDELADIALQYINAPYLWGGKTHFGIDCSALAQLACGFKQLIIPRDASQQVNCGQTIEFYQRQKNDVAFFSNDEQKIIHVGILSGKNEVVHASGCVHLAPLDEKGIWNESINNYSHKLHIIKRINENNA